MGVFWSQVFPPKPSFTVKDIPSLNGRVFIVTGGNAGVGLELVKMLATRGGCTIYVASRNLSRIEASIAEIQAATSPRDGTPPSLIKPLVVDFNDLMTIKGGVASFLASESRLDVLWNNAGIAQVPPGSKTVQGYEAHMGVNCLGPYLFTKLLTPLLVQTAKVAPTDSVRVVFTASQIIDGPGSPGGVSLEEQKPGKHPQDKAYAYSASKVGNWFLASELDKRIRKDGVVSLVQNPGNLVTKAWNNVDAITRFICSAILYAPEYGAHTELWTGLSPDITASDGGKYALPWGGRWHTAPRADIVPSLKGKSEGGSGLSAMFWDWCDAETCHYM